MKDTRLIMGMPVAVEIVDDTATTQNIDEIFDYFIYVDEKFSTYKESSEISQINNGKLAKSEYSDDMKFVLEKCEKTKAETEGFFDIAKNGKLDPSGYVKGWAIQNAAHLIEMKGFQNYSPKPFQDRKLSE